MGLSLTVSALWTQKLFVTTIQADNSYPLSDKGDAAHGVALINKMWQQLSSMEPLLLRRTNRPDCDRQLGTRPPARIACNYFTWKHGCNKIKCLLGRRRSTTVDVLHAIIACKNFILFYFTWKRGLRGRRGGRVRWVNLVAIKVWLDSGY